MQEIRDERLENDEIEIDLGELFHVLLRKWWIIVLCFIIGGVATGTFTKFAIVPKYEASSMLYILSKTTSVTSLADIQLGAQLSEDFVILATSRPVLDQVIEELELKTTYDDLKDIISVTNLTDTRILKISVTHSDPEVAMDISNAMAVATADRMAQVMGTDPPSIAEEAVLPEKPASPSMVKNTAIGALLGLLGAAGIIVVVYMLDDAIKTEEDVTRYLHLNTLASIPVEGSLKKSKRIRKKKKSAA